MEEFGNGPTVYDRFRQWRDAGAFQALMEAVIAEAARRDQVRLSPVGVDSTTARAHHDAAGMRVDARTLAALEKALTEGRGPGNEQKDQGAAEAGDVAEAARRDERRRLHQRFRARLKAAALSRSRGGLTEIRKYSLPEALWDRPAGTGTVTWPGLP
ncbi:hypothetical protein NEH83_02420 [Streptomyces sp. JUS-F4]|uniref:transposase n=1 Tax=Streptomyces TaxID=1883 RepID=UPI000B0D0C5B|nr:transposase [Streptomyces sp. JUS-F4]WKN13149.1 hypothetical protein NEH83_02420 [Streptomyces sp. JUS-F4]